jgi:hypothetical protein
MNDAARLNALLEKYRFVDPVPDAARRYMLKSRRRILIACLKKVNNYSIFFAVVLFVYFLARKLKLNFSLTSVKIIAVSANIAVAGIAAGTVYTAVKFLPSGFKNIEVQEKNIQTDAKPAVKSESKDKITEKQAPVNAEVTGDVYVDILLFNGKIIRGVILSRGNTYIIKTPQGIISVPSTQVRNIMKIQ